MPHAQKADTRDAAPENRNEPFEIKGPDAAGVLWGSGCPALDAGGRPKRVIYVDILHTTTGRTWFGATRNWTLKEKTWHWSLDLGLAADTANKDGSFDREAGKFEVMAYFEEKDLGSGRLTTVVAEPFELTVAESDEIVQPTASIPVVLARIRELSDRRVVAPRLPEDRFVFRGREAPLGSVAFSLEDRT